MRKFTPYYQVNPETEEMPEPLNTIHNQNNAFYKEVWRTEIAKLQNHIYFLSPIKDLNTTQLKPKC